MKIGLRKLPDDKKDQFYYDLITTEWWFKIAGWIVLIGTLQYAAKTTDNGWFKGAAFALTLNLSYLVQSFVQNRIRIEILNEEGNYPRWRLFFNFLCAGIVGWCAWYIANKLIANSVAEIVEFQSKPKP
jgi:hypothetical protein